MLSEGRRQEPPMAMGVSPTGFPFPSALSGVSPAPCLSTCASHVSSSATASLIIHPYSPVFCLLSCPFYLGLLFVW